MSNLDVSALTSGGNLAGARIVLVVRMDLHVAAEEGNLGGKNSPVEIGLGLLHGGGGNDAPLDYQLGCTGDRPSSHVRDFGDLSILEAEGVGGDGNLRAGTPAALNGVGGDDQTLNVALEELELDVVVVKVILGILPTAVMLSVDAKVPAVPVGLGELAAAVGLVEDDNVLGALWLRYAKMEQSMVSQK